ncbi:hypothetical protein CPB86DRAFT_632490 [Serendipita vermifera]|nr:hypothetical protein CPB86DRAFT_632490 [Serendipita vermifera]
MAFVQTRPALAPRTINAPSISPNSGSNVNAKRSRDDADDEPSASRSSTKRPRLENHPSASTENSAKLSSITTSHTLADKNEDNHLIATTKSSTKESASAKKTKVDKEKSKAAKLAAEEDFREKYRAAFPSWKFYFDAVPQPARNAATKKIELLGAVVQGFLDKHVTHFITATKVDKENGTKSLNVPGSTSTLRSPADIQGCVAHWPFVQVISDMYPSTYNPVDKAKQWGLKIWDITKLESVLDRTLARPKATNETQNLDSLLTTEKPAVLTNVCKIANINITIGLKHNKSLSHLSTAFVRPSVNSMNTLRDKRTNSASTTLAGLLATEKATNTTLERDPLSRRHDFTYFNKLSAFVIVEVLAGDCQTVGRLEYKPPKTGSGSGYAITSSRHGTTVEAKLAFNNAHRGPTGDGAPEYPILHLDPRMRSPFQPFTTRAQQKEKNAEKRDREEQEEKESLIRLLRAHRRRAQSLQDAVSLNDLKNAALNAHLLEYESLPFGATKESVDPMDHYASGFLRSAGTAPSMASLSTATGVPTTATLLNTSYSLSRSGGGGSWTKFVGAGGVVPSFGNVRHATQVVMNKGAFAATETSGAPSVSQMGAPSVPQSNASNLVRASSLKNIAALGGADDHTLRRTKSLVTMKSQKEVAPVVEEKKPEGYCECCKEHYDSLNEHVKGRKHRKFASDPRRYRELDLILCRMARVKKETRSRVLEDRERQRLEAIKRYERKAAHSPASFTPRRPVPGIAARPTPTPSRWAKVQQINEQESFAETTSPIEESTPPTLTAGTSTTVNSTCITPTEETSINELNSIPAIVAMESAGHGEDAQAEDETSYQSMPHEVIVISSTEPNSSTTEEAYTESVEQLAPAPEVTELLTSPSEENIPSLVADPEVDVAQNKWVISDSRHNTVIVSLDLFDGDLSDEEDA